MHPTVYHLSRLSSEIHLNSPRYATTPANGFGSTRKQKNRTARCGNLTPEKLLFLQWSQCDATLKGNEMLSWALTFLIVALIAAALGFTGIAGAASSIAQILFVIFIVLFVVAMVARAVRGQPPM